jgi:hypothetical protein
MKIMDYYNNAAKQSSRGRVPGAGYPTTAQRTNLRRIGDILS